jgi:hypothetical protein
MSELVIRNLHVSIEGKEILKGFNLTIKQARFMRLGPERHREVYPGLCHDGSPLL